MVFPNPFSYSTVISFTLLQSQKVYLKIYDVNKRLVKVVADKIFEQGIHNVEWKTGNTIKQGIYFLEIQSGDFFSNRKINSAELILSVTILNQPGISNNNAVTVHLGLFL